MPSRTITTTVPPTPAAATRTVTASATHTHTAVPPTFTVEPPPTATPTPGCAQTRSRMEEASIATTLQPWPVAVRVFLPPCYDPDRIPGYPLLVLLHGQTYTNDQWDRDGMDEAADRLTAAGIIRPLIIVMPAEAHSERLPQKSNFDAVVAGSVLPWIDAQFNTCPDRSCRAVGGISRGASWAVRIGFLHPPLFGSIGAHSYPPFVGDTDAVKRWIAGAAIGDLPRFYLDMGDHDLPEYITANREFRAELTRLGIPLEWHENAGGHNDAYWSAHVEEYLLWYSQSWAGLA
jgi:enterochelin esterase-like enzyme